MWVRDEGAIVSAEPQVGCSRVCFIWGAFAGGCGAVVVTMGW